MIQNNKRETMRTQRGTNKNHKKRNSEKGTKAQKRINEEIKKKERKRERMKEKRKKKERKEIKLIQTFGISKGGLSSNKFDRIKQFHLNKTTKMGKRFD